MNTAVRRRSGGPRTERGKRWSSRNATKHGIFAMRPLADEPAEEYAQRVAAWRDSLQPADAMEEALVEQLVLLLLRERRLLEAEAAEIMRIRENLPPEWQSLALVPDSELGHKLGKYEQRLDSAMERTFRRLERPQKRPFSVPNSPYTAEKPPFNKKDLGISDKGRSMA